MRVFLMVDDSPVICKVADRLLTDLGFVVTEASDGLEAIEKARYNMPDVMLVDWDLPSMNGVEVIEEFRKIEGSEKTKVLYCTSEVMLAEMTKAKRAGANGFIMKPFNREILAHKLAEIGVLGNESHAA